MQLALILGEDSSTPWAGHGHIHPHLHANVVAKCFWKAGDVNHLADDVCRVTERSVALVRVLRGRTGTPRGGVHSESVPPASPCTVSGSALSFMHSSAPPMGVDGPLGSTPTDAFKNIFVMLCVKPDKGSMYSLKLEILVRKGLISAHPSS